MKEDIRNLALQKLKTLKSEREELLSLQKELNDLKENDLVKKYLFLDSFLNKTNIESDEYLTEMNVDDAVKKLTSMFGGKIWVIYIIIHLMMET